jgi:hypothetical protein
VIPFTQYVRPDGRRRFIEIERPPEIEARARALIEKGLVFEAEVLVTGEVSLTVGDPVEEEDIAIEITPNCHINEAVDRLIGQAEAVIVSQP